MLNPRSALAVSFKFLSATTLAFRIVETWLTLAMANSPPDTVIVGFMLLLVNIDVIYVCVVMYVVKLIFRQDFKLSFFDNLLKNQTVYLLKWVDVAECDCLNFDN
jgi:hypothetical protein